MARDGGKVKKTKVSTKKGPDPSSNNSKKRAKRGFKGLEVSSRKHRRAAKRQASSRFFDSKDHQPGEKGLCANGPNPRKQWLFTAGGANKYH